MANLQPSLVLRLPRAALARRDVVSRLATTWQARKLFAFKCDELAFARDLLAKRTNLWLYRTSQRGFAGDFVIVDVSSADVATRLVTFVELKLGEPLRSASRTSVQLRNAPAALRELAESGVIAEGCPVRAVTGGRAEVLSFLGKGASRAHPTFE
jgi:hypothetical protein